MKDSLTSYLREPEQDFLDLASTSAGDFKEALGRYRQLRTTEEESDQADELETLFDESIDEINVAVDLDESILANEQEFSDLRANLEGALDEEAQVQRNLHAAEARGGDHQSGARRDPDAHPARARGYSHRARGDTVRRERRRGPYWERDRPLCGSPHPRTESGGG